MGNRVAMSEPGPTQLIGLSTQLISILSAIGGAVSAAITAAGLWLRQERNNRHKAEMQRRELEHATRATSSSTILQEADRILQQNRDVAQTQQQLITILLARVAYLEEALVLQRERYQKEIDSIINRNTGKVVVLEEEVRKLKNDWETYQPRRLETDPLL